MHRLSYLVIFAVTTWYLPATSFADAPLIAKIDELATEIGKVFSHTPRISNSKIATEVNWSKAYGPDGVKVNPINGTVSWAIPPDQPSESFYIGLRASNSEGSAIEYFILHAGVPKVVKVGKNGDYKNLKDAYSKETGSGTTFIVESGEYTDENFVTGITSGGSMRLPANGSPTAYSTLIAEEPSAVTISGDAKILIPGGIREVGYLAIKGFFFKHQSSGIIGDDCAESKCKPHHIKFIANGAEGLEHIPFIANNGIYLLFENNYAYGGGRAKFSLYKSDHSILRRNVARYDRSESILKGLPKNTFVAYSTNMGQMQNNIAVDGDHSEFISDGARTGEFGCATGTGVHMEIDGNIQLNSALPFTRVWASTPKMTCIADLSHNVAWDIRPEWRGFILSRGSSLFDHFTLGDYDSVQDEEQLINGWPSDQARGVINSILHNIDAKTLFFGLEKESTITLLDQNYERYGVQSTNISGFSGRENGCCTTLSDVTHHDPIYSTTNKSGALRYIVRPEPISKLANLDTDGNTLGATIMHFKGSSGSTNDQKGTNLQTSTPIWPFPMQEIIAAKMRDYRHEGNTFKGASNSREIAGTGVLTGNRGYAVEDQTLTHYIWSYIGNTVPPLNVTATGADHAAIIKWDPSAAIEQSEISGYRVYDYNPTTHELSNPREVSAKELSFTVTKLENGKTYHFVVTAIHKENAKGESGYSYPATAKPQEQLDPLAPIVKLL